METNAKLFVVEGKNLNDAMRIMQKPKKPRLEAVRRIMKYAKGTLDCGLYYMN